MIHQKKDTDKSTTVQALLIIYYHDNGCCSILLFRSSIEFQADPQGPIKSSCRASYRPGEPWESLPVKVGVKCWVREEDDSTHQVQHRSKLLLRCGAPQLLQHQICYLNTRDHLFQDFFSTLVHMSFQDLCLVSWGDPQLGSGWPEAHIKDGSAVQYHTWQEQGGAGPWR